MNLRRRLLALSLAVLGCESIAPRTTPDASVDAGATVDAPDALTRDIVDASIVDAPDVQTTDALDVQTADIVDAPVADAPDVVTADIVDAPDVTTADIVDASVADTPDVATPDVVDASVADTPDAAAPDVVDASVNPFPSTGADGPFPGTRVPNDAGVIELEPRVWNFTTVHVPRRVALQFSVGSGVAELRATGDIVIEGTVNASGGAGGERGEGSYSLGGDTGVPHGPRLRLTGGSPRGAEAEASRAAVAASGCSGGRTTR